MRKQQLNRQQILNLQKFSEAYLNKQSSLDYYPLAVQIEPTNHCDFHCDFCGSNNKEFNTPKGFMERELYCKIIDEIKDKTLRLGLVWRGEPLLHKEIVDFVKIAAQHDLYPYLVTNASRLEKNISRQLIDAGLDYISFSVDSLDSKTYEQYRKGGNFDTTIKNIKDFIAVRQTAGRPDKPYTVISMIEFEKTDHDSIKKYFNHGINRFDFPSPHNWAGAINTFTDTARKQDFVVRAEPWKKIIVSWDGTVYPCCMDFGGQVRLGNIQTQSIYEIWTCDRFNDFRNLIGRDKNSANKLCRQCGLYYIPPECWKL